MSFFIRFISALQNYAPAFLLSLFSLIFNIFSVCLFFCFVFFFHCQFEFEECEELGKHYATSPCYYCINLQVEVDVLL